MARPNTNIIKKRKHHRFLGRGVISSAIIYLLFICGCHLKSYNEVNHLYTDYDFYTQKGIKELTLEDKVVYNKGKKPYVELIYRNGNIDSIVMFNLTTNPFYIRPILNNKSSALYEITIPDVKYGNIKDFLLFRDSILEHYIFATPILYADSTFDCQYIKMTKDTSFRINCLIKQSDTINFSNKLISGIHINIYQRLDTMSMKKQVIKGLTLVNYFCCRE